VIGTVEHRYGRQSLVARNTTPESYELQKLFKEMVDKKVQVCVMEVSSHALALNRVVDCHFDGAVFSNLSREHLDYHQGMEAYFKMKLKLFQERLAQSSKNNLFSAINIDDPFGRRILENIGHKVTRYSLSTEGEVKARNLVCTTGGLKMQVVTPQVDFICNSFLLGRFNAQNILAAVSAALNMNIPLEIIKRGLEKVSVVPGRFEKISNTRGVLAFVDYAHTPDALKNVLLHARELLPSAQSRLITVFGCGGDRDRSKRPLMGEVVSRLSDLTIITNDNPRSEEPEAIVDNILAGIEKKNYKIIIDRRRAIKEATALAKPGDVILVAGKGHENYQIVGSKRRHFDDREVLRKCLGKG
jgi:UDP-N-acetylmuramoyl-L-alanyl-D-glutamate--2,6-diaminopimelate ligase